MVTARRKAAFESKLGYKFNDRGLLKRALTHASAQSGSGRAETLNNNERLEFLGDRVLGLAVAELINERLQDAREGEMARTYNLLVRGEACAEVARDIGLGDHLILSESEAGSGGREKVTILADACEAVLGAVFLEAGFEVARAVVRKHWGPRLDALPTATVDAKTALQEWAQARGLSLPVYREIQREGPDHAPKFTSEVRVTGRKQADQRTAEGRGASKRAAEQAAAAALLAREGVWGAKP
ncbi:MAG TPA: ribonuclease III [Hyphomicrobiaceae bacterium]|nr:ribonuclease III [Hyphomicrobiaceae bacterium]